MQESLKRNMLMRELLSENQTLRLFIITVLIFIAFSLLLGERFFSVRNLQSMAVQFPEFGILAFAILITMLTGGILAAIGGPVMAAFAILAAEDVAAIAIVIPMMFYAAGVGLVMPATTAAAIGPYPEKAGAASSLLGFFQMCFAAATGATVAHVLDGTARPMAVAIAVCGLATLATILVLRRRV